MTRRKLSLTAALALSSAGAGVALFLLSSVRARRAALESSPAAGKIIGLAPDPSASSLPENRHIDADAAESLRRMVMGE